MYLTCSNKLSELLDQLDHYNKPWASLTQWDNDAVNHGVMIRTDILVLAIAAVQQLSIDEQ